MISARTAAPLNAASDQDQQAENERAPQYKFPGFLHASGV